MKNYKFHYFLFLSILHCITGCREDELVVPTEYDIIADVPAADTQIRGFYLVNEGNMGSNKCTIDYMDYFTGLYSRNIYAERNPNVIKELGDVGNDIGIYGSKLYVVVNCSHKIEVMDTHTGIRIGQVDIPNCRYVRFYRGSAYVSSYVGPVRIDPDAPKGAVYRVDTLSLAVTGKVSVGYQPEEMEIIDDYMYVANSGGYRAPNYDNTVSVIQMVDFKQVRQIMPGVAVIGFALIVGGVIAVHGDKFLQSGLIIFACIFCHNAFGYVLGYVAAKFFGMSTAKKRTLSIEVGVQNAGLATGLCGKFFPTSAEAAIASAVSCVWHSISGTILANIFLWFDKKAEENNNSVENLKAESEN